MRTIIKAVGMIFLTLSAVQALAETKEKQNPDKTPRFLIGTNALYDAAMIPNVEGGMRIGRTRSLHLRYSFPWKVSNDNRFAAESQHLALTLRQALSRKNAVRPFTGWWIEAGAEGGYYDLENEGEGMQGEFASVTLGAGHSWRIADGWRLTAGLSIAGTYSNYRKYTLKYDNRYLVWNKSRDVIYTGPQRIEVTIHHMFGERRRDR